MTVLHVLSHLCEHEGLTPGVGTAGWEVLVLVEAPDCFPQDGAEQGNGAPQALYCPFPSQPPVFGASGMLSHVLLLCFVMETNHMRK